MAYTVNITIDDVTLDRKWVYMNIIVNFWDYSINLLYCNNITQVNIVSRDQDQNANHDIGRAR